jgi:4-amino-4-deoxy-L-arabinose transferase-like glycosyltransferase
MRLSREVLRSFTSVAPPVGLRQRLEASWFPTALGLYLLLAAGLRFLMARSLMFDESEQLALSQVLSLGYGSQPPLVVWLVYLATAIFGPSAATIIGVRFAILGTVYAGLYSCARTLTRTPERAALATATALCVPAVCWDFVLDKTNTPLACAMAAFTFGAVVRAVRSGSICSAVAVGFLVGLGILSKYTFLPFAAGLALASLTLPEYRRWVLSVRGVIAAGVAVALVLPHAVWVIASRAELADGLTQSLTNRPDRMFGALLTSAGDVLLTSCGVTLAVFAVVFWKGAKPETACESKPLAASPAVALLGRTLLFAMFTAMLVVVLAGGNRFKAHWFTPMAVLLPAYFVARLDARPLARWRLMGLWSAVGAIIVGTAILGVMAATTDWLPQGRQLHARDRLASELAVALADHPESIVCDALRDAGNLRLACPGSPVAVLRTPLSSRPALRGSVVLVWDASRTDAIYDETAMLLLRDYGLCPDPTATVTFVGERQSPANPGGRRLGVVRLITNATEAP